MTKPMYCPMSFGLLLPKMNRRDGELEFEPYYFKCTPDCAWAAIDLRNDCYACGMLDVNLLGTQTNWRPLEEDDDE